MAKIFSVDFLLGSKLKSAFGRNFDLAGKKIDSLGKKLTATQKLALQQQANEKTRRTYKDKLAGAAALGASIVGLGKAYGSLADAQGQIASLGIGDAGISVITAAAKKFSNTWAGTTAPEFIAASYDIKSGISSLGDMAVGEFTRIAALTGKATKSSTAEQTALFAKGYGIYRKQFNTFAAGTIAGWKGLSAEERDIEFGKYFSAGISSAVQMFRTDGSQMSQALSNLGSAASSAGYSFSEQLAVLGNLQSVFSGSESATKFRAFLRTIPKAAEKLGLEFVDPDTGKLKDVASILELINEQYDGNLESAMAQKDLVDAFGDEAVGMVVQLAKNTDSLRASTKALNGSLKQGTIITKQMAMAMQRGPNASFSLLWQRSLNLAAALGKALTPTINLVAGGLGKMASWVDALVTRFPVASGIIGGVVGVVSALAIASIGLGYAWTFVYGGILKLKTAWLLLNSSFLASPIGWVVAGAVALGAAAYLIYKNWEPIKAFFVSIGDWFKNISWHEIGANLINTLASGIWSGISAPFAAVKGVLGKVRELLPFSDAKTGPLSQLTLAGRKTMETYGSGIKEARPGLSALPGGATTSPGTGALNITISPTIHFTSGMDQAQARQAVNQGMMESEGRLRQMMENMMANDRRLSYA